MAGSDLTSSSKDMNDLQTEKIVKKEVVASGKWLAFRKITYTDKEGVERIWEAVSRTTRHDTPADGVAMVALLRRALKHDCLVCVRQFRPAMAAHTIEFPAGLMDRGESPTDAAIRELKEETGYTGQVKHISPATCLDPGAQDATLITVTVEIDGDDPLNMHPVQQEEFIEVVHIPLANILPVLNSYSARGDVIDSRLYNYAIAHTQATKERCPVLEQK